MSARWLHHGAVTAYLGLLGLLMARMLWLSPPPPELRSPLLVVIVAPLLIPLRGLLQARRYTMAWSSMLILAYFVHGVAVTAGGPGAWAHGLPEVLLSLAYFALAIGYVRASRPGPA